MSLTPEEIHAQRFHDAFKGYNHEEVDVFLDQVAASFTAIYQEVQLNRHRLADLQSQLDDVKGTETMLKRTLLAAQRAADEAIAEANAEAQRLLDTANAKATEVVDKANRQASDTIAQATRQASDTIARANRQASDTIAQANRQASDTTAQATRRADALLADATARQAQLQTAEVRMREMDAQHRSVMRDHLQSLLKALDELPVLPPAARPTRIAQAPNVRSSPAPVPPVDLEASSQAGALAKAGPQPEGTERDGRSPQTEDVSRVDVPGISQPPSAVPPETKPPPFAPPGEFAPKPASSFGGSSRQGGFMSPWSRSAEVGPGAGDDLPEAGGGREESPPAPPGGDKAEEPEPSVRELFWGKG